MYFYRMKTKLIFSLLLTLITLSSFMQDESVKNSFSATVDGKKFQVQDDQLFRGLLINKNASADGKIPERTVISAIFNGELQNVSDEKTFAENIQFEINYEDGKTGEPSYYALALQHQSGKYYLLKDQSKLTVTQFVWESDKKHFRISAEFNCKMRSWDTSSDKAKDVNVKGKMENIRITVPSWLAVKN